jgi:hypothetical protein
MSNSDRIVILLVSAVVAILYFTNVITGTLGLVLLIIAGIFVLTGLIGFCPVYTLIGVNTCSKKMKNNCLSI